MAVERPEAQSRSTITNSIGIKLVLVPAGEFMMGGPEPAEELAQAFRKSNPKLQPDDVRDEYPQHRVRITKPFYLGAHEITLGQFRRFVSDSGYQTDAEKDGEGGYGYDATSGELEGPKPEYSWRNTGFTQTDDYPVVNVTWNDAVAFCEWLSRKEGKSYRLPTEAEWEYACRAGTQTRYYFGDDPEGLAQVGNVTDAAVTGRFPDWSAISANDGYILTAAVGRFKPNPFGLYDTHGNVGEWCLDWYDEAYYADSPIDDPSGPASGRRRINRGGHWGAGPFMARSACRDRSPPAWRDISLGFRTARTP